MILPNAVCTMYNRETSRNVVQDRMCRGFRDDDGNEAYKHTAIALLSSPFFSLTSKKKKKLIHPTLTQQLNWVQFFNLPLLLT